MSGQEDGLAALADAAHQVPDRASRLGVQPGSQLVEKHHLWIVNQRKRNEQPLLLASGEVHKPGVPLLAEAELLEQALGVHGLLVVKRSPEVYRLPHFDALLQLRLLELNSDPLL